MPLVRGRALVVDDRLENRESTCAVLVAAGYATEHVSSLNDALDRLHSENDLDLIFTRANEDGFTLVRHVKRVCPELLIVVYTSRSAVDGDTLALKLWPRDTNEILVDRNLIVGEPHANVRLSAGERWARFVIRATNSSEDLRTLAAWAKYVGVSYSSLREACYLLEIVPRQACDFMRALRAVLWLSRRGGRFAATLEVSDRRSIDRFVRRIGVAITDLSDMTVEHFLSAQRLIPADNEALLAIRRALQCGARVNPN